MTVHTQISLLQVGSENSDDERVLETLRQDFDKHLDLLRSADVAERAHRIMDEPILTKGCYRVAQVDTDI